MSRRTLQQMADAHRAYARSITDRYDQNYHIGMAHAYESLLDSHLLVRPRRIAKVSAAQGASLAGGATRGNTNTSTVDRSRRSH